MYSPRNTLWNNKLRNMYEQCTEVVRKLYGNQVLVCTLYGNGMEIKFWYATCTNMVRKSSYCTKCVRNVFEMFTETKFWYKLSTKSVRNMYGNGT